jgi:hypothetical protein
MSKFVQTANGSWPRADLIKEIHCRNGAYIAVCNDGESRQLCPAFDLNDLVINLSSVVPAVAELTAYCFTWDDEQDQPHIWKTSVVAWRITDYGPLPVLLDGSAPDFGAIEDHGRFVIPCSERKVYYSLDEVVELYKEFHEKSSQRQQPDTQADDAADGGDTELAEHNADDNVCAFPRPQTHKSDRTIH